jgi:hypothetical protein
MTLQRVSCTIPIQDYSAPRTRSNNVVEDRKCCVASSPGLKFRLVMEPATKTETAPPADSTQPLVATAAGVPTTADSATAESTIQQVRSSLSCTLSRCLTLFTSPFQYQDIMRQKYSQPRLADEEKPHLFWDTQVERSGDRSHSHPSSSSASIPSLFQN